MQDHGLADHGNFHLFDGFICSFGSLGDLVWFISRKIRKKPFKISEKADRILKMFKYVLLILLVV